MPISDVLSKGEVDEWTRKSKMANGITLICGLVVAICAGVGLFLACPAFKEAKRKNKLAKEEEDEAMRGIREAIQKAEEEIKKVGEMPVSQSGTSEPLRDEDRPRLHCKRWFIPYLKAWVISYFKAKSAGSAGMPRGAWISLCILIIAIMTGGASLARSKFTIQQEIKRGLKSKERKTTVIENGPQQSDEKTKTDSKEVEKTLEAAVVAFGKDILYAMGDAKEKGLLDFIDPIFKDEITNYCIHKDLKNEKNNPRFMTNSAASQIRKYVEDNNVKDDNVKDDNAKKAAEKILVTLVRGIQSKINLGKIENIFLSGEMPEGLTRDDDLAIIGAFVNDIRTDLNDQSHVTPASQ